METSHFQGDFDPFHPVVTQAWVNFRNSAEILGFNTGHVLLDRKDRNWMNLFT